MSDNRRRYHTIRRALKQLYAKEPTGNQSQHLNTLAGLINCQLPDIARKVLDGTKKENRAKRFHRWLKNEWCYQSCPLFLICANGGG